MDSDILLIGHRGCADQYPENTIDAFRQAGRRLPALEVDVQRCGSGELIAFHDETFERLTSRSSAVAETPWKEISELEILDSGEPIPLFKSVLKAWPEGVIMNLDIHDPTIVNEALEQAQAAEFNDRIILSSTDPDALKNAYRWLSRSGKSLNITLGYSFHTDVEPNINVANDLGCTYVHIPAKMCRETSVVEHAHNAGLMTDAWTITTQEDAELTAACGVDAMTINHSRFRDVV